MDDAALATMLQDAHDALTTTDGASRRLLPWLVAVASFMESLDTTFLNTAVPTTPAALRARVILPAVLRSVVSVLARHRQLP